MEGPGCGVTLSRILRVSTEFHPAPAVERRKKERVVTEELAARFGDRAAERGGFDGGAELRRELPQRLLGKRMALRNGDIAGNHRREVQRPRRRAVRMERQGNGDLVPVAMPQGRLAGPRAVAHRCAEGHPGKLIPRPLRQELQGRQRP